MSEIKKLAGQTGLYGISSILGRVLNYLLVFLYTSVFLPKQFGVITELYAYTAFFNILYTYGMETAFFRFSTKTNHESYVYDLSTTAILITSTLYSALLYVFAQPIVNYLGYPEVPYLVKWLAFILWIDAIVAIPFAKLRLDNRALKFVVARMSSIVLNIFLNVLFLYILPGILARKFLPGLAPWVSSWFSNDLGVGYVILANLIGNASMLLILYKELFSIKLRINWSKFKPMLWYSFPIFIMGLAGMTNEQLDKILLEHLLPAGFYAGVDAQGALGIYGACFRLSVFMILAIQAFRYAGEPFFFSNAEDKNAPKLFARVLFYFLLLCLIIFVGVSVNVDLIGHIFLRKAVYREALFVVPILLMGKLLFGIYINLTVWFKISDKTRYGTYFSIVGALATILGNIILVPLIGYLGSALTTVFCYGTMSGVCYYYGQKHFPIPYNWKKMGIHTGIAVGIVALFFLIPFPTTAAKFGAGLVISLLYAGLVVWKEGRHIFQKTI